MTIFELPKATLTYDVWLVKDKEQEVVGKAEENGLVQIEDKEKVNYLYIGDDDSIDTIHLYAYTKDFKNTPDLPKETPFITLSSTNEIEDTTPSAEPDEEKTSIVDLFNPSNPITGDRIITFITLASLSLVFIIISRKKKKKSSSVIY